MVLFGDLGVRAGWICSSFAMLLCFTLGAGEFLAASGQVRSGCLTFSDINESFLD